jgi:hypothetical protein
MADPLYFAATFLDIRLHPGQSKWLDRSGRRENILVTGNRWGKSFVSAIKLIHHAIYRPRKLCFDRSGRYRAIVASITQDQANLIFNTALRLITQSDILAPIIRSLRKTPYPKMTLGNGATIEARTTQNRGEYLLGNDYDLFIFDEVAFETDPEYVVEEVILMRLADREGRLDLVSTPNGKNWFHRRARDVIDGKRDGYFQSGDSRENPHISREFLDERVNYFSQARLKQNIMGQFVDSGGEILKGAYVDKALRGWEKASQEAVGGSTTYITGWDLARKRTATVGITVAVCGAAARVVALERHRNNDWKVVLERIKQRQGEYPGRLLIDATGLGDVIVEELADYNPQPVIFTPATKAELLINVELMHAQERILYQRWELPDGSGKTWSLEDELREARWDNNSHCDGLMALALALWPLRRRPTPIIAPRVGRV